MNFINELFPVESEREKCWYCEREFDELNIMSDGAMLCPECRELKECDECGNMVSFIYSIEGYNDFLCEECFYIGLAEFGAS